MPAGHDSNALLIGALYGELSSAEQADLQAHLSAHPGDQELLRQLTRTREAVRGSAVLTPVEPPQAISALLLQEAARRSRPRSVMEHSGLWSRLARWCGIALAHPGLAAAMMAVVVFGVFGTMALRGKDRVAESTIAPRSAAATPEAQPSAPADQRDGARLEPAPAAEPYAVDLDLDRAEQATDKESASAPKSETPQKKAIINGEVGFASKPKPSRDGYLDAKTPEVALKDLDDVEGQDRKAAGRGKQAGKQVGDDAVATAPASVLSSDLRERTARGDSPITSAASGSAVALQPEEKATANRASSAEVGNALDQEPAVPSAVAPSTATVSSPTVDRQLGEDERWAKGEHVRLVRLVRATRCGEAAAVAKALSQRAPRFYQDHVAGDRELRVCASALRDAVNLPAESSKRKRSVSVPKTADDTGAATRK
jgi:hypothetical protein